MHQDPFRITNPALKVGAVVFGALVRIVASFFVYMASPLLAFVFLPVAEAALIYAATRVFRVAGEPLVPARAWWRATGRPLAGFVVAALFALWSAAVVLRIAVGFRGSLNAEVVGGLFVAVVAIIFFLHSSIRLLRGGRGEEAEDRSAPAPRDRSLAKPFRFREFG
jgi:hypothetical protein